MTSSTSTVRLLRFTATQRVVHWLNALLFGALIVTAVPLYFGSLGGVVLPRHLVEEIHLWCGLALPVPLLVSLLGPWGRAMRADLRRVSLWTHDEIRWLLSAGRSSLSADKFNPGQKLNAIVVGATVVVMLFSGVVLQWFGHFPLSWRVGATFVHDLFSWIIVFVIVGHVAVALAHRDSLVSMVRGSVPRAWAERHARRWLAEEPPTAPQ